VADPNLVTVRLLGVPVALHAQSSEHTEELMREFTYLRAQAVDPDGASVPSRLLDLVDELNTRYDNFAGQQQAEVNTAVERGDATIDLVFIVPADIAKGMRDLVNLLDEADEFCRDGGALLTLETPVRIVTYRQWAVDQFERQCAGLPPTRWL
jgi:hypothetical protein